MDRPIGDFFRFIFGLERGNPFRQPFHCEDHDDSRPADDMGMGPVDDDTNDEFTFFFGNDGRNGIDDMFQHFHGDMFRQMESLHRQMDEMMKGFGAITSDRPNPFDNPSIKDKPESEGHGNGRESFSWFFGPQSGKEHHPKPRDFMLKDGGDDAASHPQSKDPVPSQADDSDGFNFKWNFRVPPWSKPSPEQKKDTDLDDKMSQGDVLDLIKRAESPTANHPAPDHRNSSSGFVSSGRSFSTTIIHGPDGRVEQKKVERDSSGHEKTTVARSIGDQTHSVTTILNKQGRLEHHEDLKNIDENDFKKFEEKWNKPEPARPLAPNAPADPSLFFDSTDQKLFSRLFGGSW